MKVFFLIIKNIAYLQLKCYNEEGGYEMEITINNYKDLKALAVLKGIKVQTELPKMLGYKSRWGLKLAMENPKKKNEIINKAKLLLEN